MRKNNYHQLEQRILDIFQLTLKHNFNEGQDKNIKEDNLLAEH